MGEKKTTSLGAKVGPDLKRRAKSAAKQYQVTLSEFTRRALEAALAGGFEAYISALERAAEPIPAALSPRVAALAEAARNAEEAGKGAALDALTQALRFLLGGPSGNESGGGGRQLRRASRRIR